jgi:hypothetical protein
METKKQTKAQIERKIQNAIVFVPKDKDTKTIFFSDKGLRLTITADSAIVETGYHKHVFSFFTASGVSRPYLYVKLLIELAQEHDCKNKDGYSFERLKDVLKEKKDDHYAVVAYISWWLFNIFQPLYTIGESEIESFLVYESYIHNIASQSIILSEAESDITNKQFIDKVIASIKELTDNIEERVVIKKHTDEEIINENIEAIQEQESSDLIAIDDESKD